MASYGRFQVIQELHRTASGSVSVAKVAGDVVGARFAVKAFDITQMGLLEADAAAQAFLDRAALQKQLAQHGAQHWAPVHELRSTEDGAFYVTDVYPISAQTLLEARADLPAKALHNIISSVVAGLLELKVHKGRAHGNLKPTNILIAGRDPGSEDIESLDDARVFLTDPATDADGPEAVAADLHNIGELIHQFVLHRPSRTRGQLAWPVPESLEWSSLGPTGGQWLELCNWLLNPDPSQRASDVDSVAIALRNLTPGKQRLRKPRPQRARREAADRPRRRLPRFPRWVGKVAAAVVVLLVLAGSAVFVLSRMDESARTELTDVRGAWFGRFEEGLRDPLRRGAFRADPDLKAIVEELDRAEAEGVPLEPGTTSRVDLRAYQKHRAAVAAVRRIEQTLTPARWRKLSELVGLRQQYEARGWSQPAAYLGKLVQGAQPGIGVDVAAGVDRVLRAHPAVVASAEKADDHWRKLEANLQALEKSNDPVLKTFAAALQSRASAGVQLGDAGFEGLEGLEKDALPISGQLAKVARSGWPEGYGRERFKQEVEDTLNLANPGYDEMRAWLADVDQYALVSLPPRSELLAIARRQFQEISGEADRYPLSESDRAGYAAQRVQVETRLKALEGGRFLKKDVDQAAGEVALASAELTRDLEQLKKWVKVTDPLQWVQFVQSEKLHVASDELRKRWEVWTRALSLKGNALAADPKKLPPVTAATEMMRAALVALDQKFPPVPPGLKDHDRKWADAAWARREKYLLGLSKWADPREAEAAGTATPEGVPVPPDPAAMEPFAAEYEAWAKKLQELARHFPLRQELLTLRDLPHAWWKANHPDFWADSVVQALVAEDVKRIERVQEVATARRERLLELAVKSDVPEVALAAWKQLGEPAPRQVTPPWPSQEGELDGERHLAGRIRGIVEKINDPALKAEWQKELAAQAPQRWRRFAEAANGRLIQSAFASRQDFGVTDADIQKLRPDVRFNLRMYDAHAAARSNKPDAVLLQSVKDLQAAARELPDLKNRPDVDDLLFKLSRIDKPEPMSGRPMNKDEYQLNIAPDSPIAIQFVRVEAPGVRPFYLSTTEVSLGAFIDMVGAARSWDPAHALLGTFAPGGENGAVVAAGGAGAGGATRRGPRLWLVPQSAHLPIDLPNPLTWRWDKNREFEFAKALRDEAFAFNRNAIDPRHGDNPKYEHPMQQTPAQAALYAAGLVNCRLPTTAEWRAAYDVVRKEQSARAGAGGANLRDRTWAAQLAQPARQWPDPEVSGVFFPRGRPKSERFLHHQADDGTLLFRTVTTGGGETFMNLVGNVAEFTCDAADRFDALPPEEKRSVDGIARFAASAAAGKKLSVIGGSALSDPVLKVDEPLPVTSPAEPYADVGFRLAFSAPAQSIAQRLLWALNQQSVVVTAKAGP